MPSEYNELSLFLNSLLVYLLHVSKSFCIWSVTSLTFELLSAFLRVAGKWLFSVVCRVPAPPTWVPRRLGHRCFAYLVFASVCLHFPQPGCRCIRILLWETRTCLLHPHSVRSAPVLGFGISLGQPCTMRGCVVPWPPSSITGRHRASSPRRGGSPHC